MFRKIEAAPIMLWLGEAELDFNPFQPRTTYNPQKMEELAHSMDEHGQIQAALARRVGDRFQLAVGHRRLLTVRRGINAGPDESYMGKLRCEVREISDLEMRVFAVEENDAREPLNAVQRARSYKGIYDEFKLTTPKVTWRDVAKISKLTYRQMHREVELLDLPEEMVSALEAEKINAAHGYALLDLVDNETLQKALFRQIVKDGLSGAGATRVAAKLREKFAGSGQLDLAQVSQEAASLAKQSAVSTKRKNRAALASGTAHLSIVASASGESNSSEQKTGTDGVAQIPRLPQLTHDNMHAAATSLEWAAKGFDIMTVAPEDVAEFESEIIVARGWMKMIEEALKRHKAQNKEENK